MPRRTPVAKPPHGPNIIGKSAKARKAPQRLSPKCCLACQPAVLNNPIPAPPTVTPLPVARYVGAWTFPRATGFITERNPSSIDVLVHEENGHVKGTVVRAFQTPRGYTGDPVLRFDFSGDFQPTRRQSSTWSPPTAPKEPSN